MSNFPCQSKSFISIFFICQVSACELRPFSCYNLANDICSQTAKTVFSHLKLAAFSHCRNTQGFSGVGGRGGGGGGHDPRLVFLFLV